MSEKTKASSGDELEVKEVENSELQSINLDVIFFDVEPDKDRLNIKETPKEYREDKIGESIQKNVINGEPVTKRLDGEKDKKAKTKENAKKKATSTKTSKEER